MSSAVLAQEKSALRTTAWASRWRSTVRGRWGLQIGLVILLIYGAMALIGPYIVRADPYRQELQLVGVGPSLDAPFGYDELGRDMLARVVHGARITMGIGLAAVLIGGVVGITLGAVAGYAGRWIDSVVMRFIDVMLAFPSLILALAIVSALGTGATNLVIATGLYSIPQYARLTRATFLSLRETEFAQAARVTGNGPARIILKHLLPNSLAPLVVQTSYATAAVILAASGLSFLGLGVQPPSPEWGAMLSRGRDFLRVAPHVVAVPGIAIAILILALNLAGDGLRDLFDPRLRRR